MLRKNISDKLKRNAVLTMLSSFAFLTSFSINSQASTTYYLRVLFDEGSFGLINQVVVDKGEGEFHIERENGVNFEKISNYKYSVNNESTSLYVDIKGMKEKEGNSNTENAPGSAAASGGSSSSNSNAYYENYKLLLEDTNKKKALTFSFPGITQNIKPEVKYTALSSDAARAELVGNTLVKGLNDALAFIKTYSGGSDISEEGFRIILDRLSARVIKVQDSGTYAMNTGGATEEKKGFTIYRIKNGDDEVKWSDKEGLKVKDELTPVNGLRYSDYIVLGTTVNGKGTPKVYGYFPWRMAKGYYDDQPLANIVGKEYVEAAKGDFLENKYLTWSQLVTQAGVNADYRGADNTDVSSDTMTLIGKGLGSDFTNAISSMRSMLNLSPIQELILNMGGRTASHHMGALTNNMYDTAKSVYALVLAVSLLILCVTVVNAIHNKILSTTNIVAKVTFMEKIQDLAVVAIMLAVFPSLFELMLEVNFWVVRTFSFSSEYLAAYGITGNKVLATESLAGAMISSMFLSIDTYINMTYLVRSIVLAFLFAISPLVTVLYPLGPTQKKMYIGFLREVVGTIFMQSFHAITMCFFAGYNSTNISSMEALVSAYCFIPITQLFKQFVIGHTGFAESVGGKLAGQLVNTASGMQKAGVMAKQSQELLNQEAKNARNSAIWNGVSQATSLVADTAGGALAGNVMAKEIGNSGNKGSGGKPSGLGGNLKGAAVGAAFNIGGAAIGGAMTGFAEKHNRNELGKLQMEHSMENIGLGLAQAGVGLGVSSFDSGVGGGMINSGMSTVQEGAKQYGQSISNTGEGGTNWALAEGINTFADQGMRGLSGTARGYVLNRNRELLDHHKNEQAKAMKEEAYGIDFIEALKALGIDGPDDALRTIQVATDDKTGKTVVSMPTKTIQKLIGANASIKYVQEAQNGYVNLNTKSEAEKDGMIFAYGGDGSGIMGDIMDENKIISIAMNNLSDKGITFDGSGNAFKITKNTAMETISEKNTTSNSSNNS